MINVISYLKNNFLLTDSEISDFVSIFVNSLHADKIVFEKSLETYNFSEILNISHKLKTAFYYIGKTHIGETFELIHKSAQTKKDINQIIILYQQIQSEIASLMEQLLIMNKHE